MEAEESNIVPFKNLESNSNPQDSIDFSIKVVDALSFKCKNSLKRVSLSQLKKVYAEGALNKQGEDKTTGEWAMAYVNMFLRLVNSKKRKSKDKFFSDVDIESPDDNLPSEQDFSQASLDILKYQLNYNFKNIEELYLDESRDSFLF